ncbi:Long-chain-fatty-acid--CoA ligase 5 [Geranomyces variabilis]|nr:Long-chain-fatty-acid--CoA ligase 5 [Geranomyces variabilis]
MPEPDDALVDFNRNLSSGAKNACGGCCSYRAPNSKCNANTTLQSAHPPQCPAAAAEAQFGVPQEILGRTQRTDFDFADVLVIDLFPSKPCTLTMMQNKSLSAPGNLVTDMQGGLWLEVLLYPFDKVKLRYNPRFDCDVCLSSGASLIKVQTMAPDFALDPELFEAAYAAASVKPRVLLITSPQNRQGTTIPAAILLALLNWATERRLHVVVDEIDEIYGLPVHSGDPSEFASVFSLAIPDPARTHMIWAPSKDFCLNGLWVGACVSFNDNLQSAIRSIAILSNIATAADNLFASLLENSEWVDAFIAENRGVLLYEKTTAALDRIGVRYLESKLGVFHLDGLAPLSTAEGEITLWEECWDHGVYLAPGSAFSAPVPGYFRLGFAVKWEILEVALARMTEGLSKKRDAK